MTLNCYLQAPVTNKANWETRITRKDPEGGGWVGWHSEKDGDEDGNDGAAEEERWLRMAQKDDIGPIREGR